MDTVLFFLAALFFLTGVAGIIIPLLPGVPLCWAGCLLLKFTQAAGSSISWRSVIVWGLVAAAVTLADNLLPIWGTKAAGGSRRVVLGATLGLVGGMFFGPPGIFFGPFLGALIGALLEGNRPVHSLFQAAGAFAGLLAGIMLKLCCAGLMAWYFGRVLW